MYQDGMAAKAAAPSSVYANQIEPARAPEIHSQIASLSSNVAHLQKLVTDHEERISPIIRGEPPATDKVNSLRGAANCSIGAQLQELNDALIHLGARLHGLTLRLEV